MEIFDYFDKTIYNGFKQTDILRRVKLLKRVIDRIDVYHDYYVKEGERADMIAHDYYDSSTYTWLVYLCNDIYDPYYEWPLDTAEFYDFIERERGGIAHAQTTPKFYRKQFNGFVSEVSEYTFSKMSIEERFEYQLVTIFDYEFEVNEAKRRIKLVSNRYVDQIDRELRNLFN